MHFTHFTFIPLLHLQNNVFDTITSLKGNFPGGAVVKNLPAIQEMQVLSPGQEDPLEKEMATHSNVLAWEILWTEEAARLQSTGS